MNIFILCDNYKEKMALFDAVDTSGTIVSKLLNNLPIALMTSKNGDFYEDVHEKIKVHNQNIYDLERISFEKKMEFKNDTDEVKSVLKKVIRYNSMNPLESPSEYNSLQHDIRNRIESLSNKDYSIQRYFGLTNFIEGGLENGVMGNGEEEKNAIKKGDSKDSKDSKGLKKPKTKKGEKLIKQVMSQRKFLVPFRTKQECTSRATSKPTYTSKEELIKTIERLGIDIHFKKPLHSYTKDELCDGYMMHVRK